MSSVIVSPDILMGVAQYIGSSIQRNGSVECIDMSEISISNTTWEEFVEYAYYCMVCEFFIETPDIEKFNIGIKWLKEQNWKT